MAKKTVVLNMDDVRRIVKEGVNRIIGQYMTEASVNGGATFEFAGDENGEEAFDALMNQNCPNVMGEFVDGNYKVTVIPGKVSHVDVLKFLARHGVSFIRDNFGNLI